MYVCMEKLYFPSMGCVKTLNDKSYLLSNFEKITDTYIYI